MQSYCSNSKVMFLFFCLQHSVKSEHWIYLLFPKKNILMQKYNAGAREMAQCLDMQIWGAELKSLEFIQWLSIMAYPTLSLFLSGGTHGWNTETCWTPALPTAQGGSLFKWTRWSMIALNIRHHIAVLGVIVGMVTLTHICTYMYIYNT